MKRARSKIEDMKPEEISKLPNRVREYFLQYLRIISDPDSKHYSGKRAKGKGK